MRTLLLAMVLCAAPAGAATVEVCYNYGCLGRADVRFGEAQLEPVREMLAAAQDAAAERVAIARAVGMLMRTAGEQSPISADRAGNLADDGAHGRMDCIDHSTTTTRLLELMESRGWLRHHQSMAPARRTRLVLFQHYSAVIEEIVPRSVPASIVEPDAAHAAAMADVPDHVPVLLALCDCAEVLEDIVARDAAAERRETEIAPVPAEPGARYVVDSWFVEHGEPAVILPLAEWMSGEGPNVQ